MRIAVLIVPAAFVLLALAFHGLALHQGPGSEMVPAPGDEHQIIFFQGSAHCDECEAQKEELEKLKRQIDVSVEVITYDVDRDRLVADRYNVWIVPTVIVNGQKREGLTAAEGMIGMMADPAGGSEAGKDGVLGSFPVLFALVAGLLTGLEPCAIAFSGMIGVFIVGSAVAENRSRSLLSASIFAVTRASVFAFFGFAVAVLGASASGLRFFLLLVASAIAFFVGSSYMGWIELPTTSIVPGSSRLQKLGKGHFTPLLLGLVFGFAVLPCATPVMASLLAYVATVGRPVLAVTCLFLFGMALSAPVAAFAYLGKTYADRSRKLLQHGTRLGKALGLGLLGLSVYLLYVAF